MDLPALRVDLPVAMPLALNDVSFVRQPHGRVAELSYAIGDEEVGSVRCDGLVAATPAGSTGYNLANAGPILAWGVKGYVVSFIAPHTLAARALVVAPDDDAQVRNAAGREPVEISLDGEPAGELAPGDAARDPLRGVGQPARPARGRELLPPHPREVREARLDVRLRLMERKWWSLLAVCLATFMLLLDITVVNVALPEIQKDLNTDLTGLQWVVDAYTLLLAALTLTMGTLADRFGRRRLFVIGVGLFTLASLLCGLATSATFLHLARGLQGIGGAAMFATSLALIAQEFQGPERGAAIAAWGATIGGAVAVGPLVGGALTDGLGWEWIFFVNVPIGIGTVILAETQAGESRDPDAKRLDWAGLVTFSARALRADLRLAARQRRGLGQRADRRLADRGGGPARRRSCSSSGARSTRCSTSACSASRRSPASPTAPSRSAPGCSRCSSTSRSTCRA